MKRKVTATITRNRDNIVNISYPVERFLPVANHFRDEAVLNELIQMFIEYDDITVDGFEVDTVNGCRFSITNVRNNINGKNLTQDELASAYYHAFAPYSIII